MPEANTVLLPICVALALVGVILTGLAWRRHNKGRVIQGLAITIAPVGLYFTGLLSLVWSGIVAVVEWAVRLTFSPFVWIGFSILAFCLVLFVVGGLVTRFVGSESAQKGAEKPSVRGRQASPQKSVGDQKSGAQGAEAASGAQAKGGNEVDPEMAEIEALLKSRGIE